MDSSSAGASPSRPERGATLRPVRRLHGLCLYCGRPSRPDVCGFCSDLPLRDPLVSKARQPLSEQERMRAGSRDIWRDPAAARERLYAVTREHPE